MTTPPTLFDRVNAHIFWDYTDDIAIKAVCAEVDKEIEQLRAWVESAYREGYYDGLEDGAKQTPNVDERWGLSKTRSFAAPQQESGRE